MDWSEKLPRPIKVKGGRILKTRVDAAQYVLDLPSDRQHRQAWVTAAKALQGGASIDRVWELVVKALQMDGSLG